MVSYFSYNCTRLFSFYARRHHPRMKRTSLKIIAQILARVPLFVLLSGPPYRKRCLGEEPWKCTVRETDDGFHREAIMVRD